MTPDRHQAIADTRCGTEYDYVWDEFPRELSERAGYDGLYPSIDADALSAHLERFAPSNG